MKIACIEAFRQPLVIKDLPIPEVGPEEILVKIFASGVCHSDVHLADGEMPNFSSPIYPGHEGAGVVQKTGEKVDTIKVGDRVGVFLLGRTCGGRCHLCLRGYEIICPEAQFLGASVPGCHAEFVAVDHKFAVKLPSELKFTEVASFMCAGLTVYRGIRESRVVAPGWFTVIGIGGLGHLAVQFAKAMGFRVVAVDIDDSKLDLAKSLGAELVVNSSKEDPVKKLQREIQGAHGALVTATSASAFAQAVGIIRSCGTVVFIGLPSPDNKVPQLPIADLIWGCKTIKGSLVGDRTDLVECLEFAANKKVRVHHEVVQLDQINEVFDRLRKGKVLGRVVLQIAEEI